MRTLLPLKRHLTVLGAFVAALLVSAQGARATTTTLDVPLAGTASTSGCVPPGTFAKGHLKTNVSFKVDPLSGKMHMHTMIQSCGSKIVTLDGAEFVSNESQENITNIDADGTKEWTFHGSFRYLSPGVSENYRMSYLVHTTINANGEVTAEVTKVYIDCDVQCCTG